MCTSAAPAARRETLDVVTRSGPGAPRGTAARPPRPTPHPGPAHRAGPSTAGGSPRPVPGPRSGPGPLVARREPVAAHRHAAPPRGSWWRRFVRRHGWRAYAIPVLTVATVFTAVDVVADVSEDGARGTTASARSTLTEAPVTSLPSLPSTEPAPTSPAEGEGAPALTPTEPAATSYVEQGAGTVSVVDGISAVYGSGPLERFVVEVEDGIAVDGAQFAAAVEATLGDPRSWGAGGRLSFQRVGASQAAAGAYDFRVSLVSPGSMETYCPGVGTGGYTSCRYGERAVINLARWETAVPDYGGDIATYRHYVVNHEVGHALGNGHQECPGPGQLAPVMQQQTLGLEGCAKNAWPYPS
jgi:hypothetical protein